MLGTDVTMASVSFFGGGKRKNGINFHKKTEKISLLRFCLYFCRL